MSFLRPIAFICILLLLANFTLVLNKYNNPTEITTARQKNTDLLASNSNEQKLVPLALPPEISTFQFSGSGTEADPYQISTITQLKQLRDNINYYDKHFILKNNLTLTSEDYKNTELGWKPIGNSIYPFTGSFNGAEYTIHNLYIKRATESNVGLFGFSSGKISNIILTNLIATGSDTIGALTGYNTGSITASVVSANINANDYVGGIAGINDGSITNSSASGNIRGKWHVGALVGANRGSITTSSASGKASGNGNYNYFIGGLVGTNTGFITNSHASGNTRGTRFIGGLAGLNIQSIDDSIRDSSTYNEGLLNLGRETRTSAIISGSSASGYTETVQPELSGFISTGYAGGLVGLSRGTVTNSSATGNIRSSQHAGGLVGDNGGYITNSYASGNIGGHSFVGGLVGENFGSITYSSASGDISGERHIGGLAGDNYGGIISNSYASGNIDGHTYVGGLVGNSNTAITDSIASGNVTGTYAVGGLVGSNEDNITNSSASGTVTGENAVGGLVGYHGHDTITSSNASGNVNGKKRVGGLVGYNYLSEIIDSFASGNVTGDEHVGGLIGYNDYASIKNSFASGNVNGNSNGSLIGYNTERPSTDENEQNSSSVSLIPLGYFWTVLFSSLMLIILTLIRRKRSKNIN